MNQILIVGMLLIVLFLRSSPRLPALASLAKLATYAMVVNDLLFEDPTTQLATFAAISVAAQFLGVRWTGQMLSEQAPSAVSVARLRVMSD